MSTKYTTMHALCVKLLLSGHSCGHRARVHALYVKLLLTGHSCVHRARLRALCV